MFEPEYTPLCYASPREREIITGTMHSLEKLARDYRCYWPRFAEAYKEAADNYTKVQRKDGSAREFAKAEKELTFQLHAGFSVLMDLIEAYDTNMEMLCNACIELERKYGSTQIQKRLKPTCGEDERTGVNTAYDVLQNILGSSTRTMARDKTREFSTLSERIDAFPTQASSYYDAIKQADKLTRQIAEQHKYGVQALDLEAQKFQLCRHFPDLEKAVISTRTTMQNEFLALQQVGRLIVHQIEAIVPPVQTGLEPIQATQRPR